MTSCTWRASAAMTRRGDSRGPAWKPPRRAGRRGQGLAGSMACRARLTRSAEWPRAVTADKGRARASVNEHEF
jgi:hypothetical protein